MTGPRQLNKKYDQLCGFFITEAIRECKDELSYSRILKEVKKKQSHLEYRIKIDEKKLTEWLIKKSPGEVQESTATLLKNRKSELANFEHNTSIYITVLSRIASWALSFVRYFGLFI